MNLGRVYITDCVNWIRLNLQLGSLKNVDRGWTASKIEKNFSYLDSGASAIQFLWTGFDLGLGVRCEERGQSYEESWERIKREEGEEKQGGMERECGTDLAVPCVASSHLTDKIHVTSWCGFLEAEGRVSGLGNHPGDVRKCVWIYYIYIHSLKKNFYCGKIYKT